MILPILALWQQEFLTPYLMSQIVATLTGTIVWAIFPTGVKRPGLLKENNVFNRLLNQIYAHDGDVNACPSSHVFTSLISSYWLASFIPNSAILIYLVGIAISLSTIFTKQHYYIDVIAGIIWAILSIMIGQYIWLLI
jgi:membrane-associated phospholipid phosphatase